MPPTPQEVSLLLHPLVPESLQHNTRVCRPSSPHSSHPTNSPQVLSQIRSLTSLLLGVSAGVLGLESQWGFLYYFASQIIISALIHFISTHGEPGLYFAGSGAREDGGGRGSGGKSGKGRVGAWREIWLGGGVFEGLSGFVLGWAGVGGVIR